MLADPAGAHERRRLTDVPSGFMASTAVFAAVLEGDRYSCAPAAEPWVLRGAPGASGDHLRLQVARQICPAQTFAAAQHIASVGPAQALARRLPIRDARSLLDVGGGSGAFTIALCNTNPALRSTILDLPARAELGRRYCAEEGLRERVDFMAGDALACAWPGDQDVVLMSYLLSALGDGEVDVVLARARDSLRPGGLLVLHDVMLDDDGQGPPIAALWFLQQVAYRPDSVSFSAAGLRNRLRDHGFLPTISEVLIPGITKVVLGRKEAVR
jgi:ubiquinone/menaquinone biosynthesis C-methylase UbiE